MVNAVRAEVLVLGAGLQGTSVALELARRGVAVTLLDRDALPMNRASLRNEGKIHLGFIYANDRSLATAYLQLDGALRFRRMLSRWIDRDAEWLVPSAPFHYLVAGDSLVPAEQLAIHYAAVEDRCRREFERDPELDYLGSRPQRLARPLASGELEEFFDPARFAAGFATAELAVDTQVLAKRLRRAVDGCARIRCAMSREVRGITQVSDGFRVEGEGTDGAWCIRADQVVNATWEGRAALDQQLGIPPPENLLHRLKYRVIARLPAELRGAPSVSMVLGRYGDIVVRRDGTAFLSWYPAGLRGWSQTVEPPADWQPACRGEVPAAQARDIAAEILAGIDTWFPGVARSEPVLVDAGVIVARGRSDVDDAASALHDRSRIGVASRGGYHSVDPGKLTTAPWFALEVANRVEAIRRHGGREA